MKKPVVAIAIGDFNGIGPEVALKSIASAGIQRHCHPLLIGPLDIFQWHAKRSKIKLNLHTLESPAGKPDKKGIEVFDLGIFHIRDIQLGKVTPVAGTAAGLALHKGVELCLRRQAAALVTAPISKSALNLAGYTYPGQTELLSELTESKHVTMMLVSKELRVGLVTVHVPLRDVVASLSIQKVFGAITVVNNSLMNDFGVRRPKVAILALNPHGGEGGLFGNEDERIVIPAIELAKTQHVQVSGPFSSDAFFGTRRYEEFDAIVAMYHDQGLIPLKMSSFGRAVNFSAGLKIVRTSPDHGTAFDIAGKGIADPGSMIEAIRLAVEIARRRQTRRQRESHANGEKQDAVHNRKIDS
jgi:4-hydroxythreonine-4-phosphate dehydrogenase